MPSDIGFQTAYRDLEQRMRALAEADDDVFLPNPEPAGPVDYILICMEPSLGRWAQSPDQARSRVAEGFRNFLFSIEDFILHFSVRSFLCGPGEGYHITDLSKGAMPVSRAGTHRSQRYDRWYQLLREEVEVVAGPEARIFAVGSAVARHLKRRTFPRPFTRILHYSGQAGHARARAIVGHEESFRAFRDSISLEAVIATADRAIEEAKLPHHFRDDTLHRLSRCRLTDSRLQLMFSYKMSFEAGRS